MEGVVDTHVVHVVAQRRNEQYEDVQVVHELAQIAKAYVRKDCLRHIERVCEVVISSTVTYFLFFFFSLISILFSLPLAY
jgi:hypothetical protein